MDKKISIESFQNNIEEIIKISDKLFDSWKLISVESGTENNKFIVKKQVVVLTHPEEPDKKLITNFEYHIAFSISYGVPVLCFNIWKQSGSMLSLEEYWRYNVRFNECNMYETITQIDHPVLNQPFFTLHPCKTQEILEPLMEKSKNPVISWLSVVAPFVQLELLDDYIKIC
ncbi:ubiquitin-like-conjugating enzyme ATG10 [Diorhabda sublineata]|uniref:ubiquitin-like-conjugating enzyme ATG10 n=1 Tax=Diorhabda sublineata TaxID=1163346 RepID=UPI0024E045E0|nr:ubiquitin-like-conjugating enzyme ATG10 [Diorhabda sublineata]